jgi:hypothetical protein
MPRGQCRRLGETDQSGALVRLNRGSEEYPPLEHKGDLRIVVTVARW